MHIRHLASGAVVVISPDANLAHAAALMREHHVGALVVAGADRKPTGILTDRDIVVGAVAKSADGFHSLTVKDLLMPPAIVALENEDSRDVLKRMRRHGVRRMPVVDPTGAVTGIFSLDDALRAIAEELENVALLLREEQSHEQRRRAS